MIHHIKEVPASFNSTIILRMSEFPAQFISDHRNMIAIKWHIATLTRWA